MSRPALLVAQTGTLGGAERVLLDWSRGLERPVVLACPDGALAEAARRAGHDVVPLPARPLRRRGRAPAAAVDLVALAADVVRLVRRVRPAVVVASGARPVLAAGAALPAGAALVTIHHDLPTSRWLSRGSRAASARADVRIATSHAIAAQLGTAVVLHPGVDAARWALPDAPAGPPRALMLGALVPWKRADLALEIAARVPELSLEIAGAPLAGDPPDFLAGVRRRAAGPDLADRVRLLGAVDDPRDPLGSAHCLLHCADHEPFGLVLVEAMAAGRPVVAPASAGPGEIVTRDSGRLYAPGDAAAGAAALREALADPALRNGARARATAFDGARSAGRFADLVEDAVTAVR